MAQKGWNFNVSRCIGCSACAIACKAENNTYPTTLPAGTWPAGPEQLVVEDGRAVAVQQAYQVEGYERSEVRPFPPDHVAIELAFMSRLCEKERVAWAGKDEAEALRVSGVARRFVDEHVVRWLPRLREKVEQLAELRFYPALLTLIGRFAEADSLYLAGAAAPQAR